MIICAFLYICGSLFILGLMLSAKAGEKPKRGLLYVFCGCLFSMAIWPIVLGLWVGSCRNIDVRCNATDYR
jgi:hypothetical protein